MITKRPKINYESGQAMMTMVIFFLFASMVVVFGIVNPILKQVAVSKNLVISKESYYLSNSSVEDVYYRLKSSKIVDLNETLSLNNATTTTVITNTPTGKKIVSIADKKGNIRKIETNIVFGSGASFNYGVQTGQGGFVLENTASVKGNIYSSGSVIGSGGNYVYGDVVSAGPSGLIDGIHATGSAYSNTIRDSIVDKDAYYVVKTGTTVAGTSYPGSANQPFLPLPISDEQIASMEADALAGGVISSPCPYNITTNQTLGPKKITCDVNITGNPTVTLNGYLWVTGNVNIANTAIIRAAPSLGSASVAIIADNPNNLTSSSKIDLNNSVQFFGSGSIGSYIFLISQNNSAETGGTIEAISMDNTVSGQVILYAPHGLVSINNSATLKEVTGYKIKAKNSATIIYDSGLVNTLFTGGPGGGYEIIDWREVE